MKAERQIVSLFSNSHETLKPIKKLYSGRDSQSPLSKSYAFEYFLCTIQSIKILILLGINF